MSGPGPARPGGAAPGGAAPGGAAPAVRPARRRPGTRAGGRPGGGPRGGMMMGMGMGLPPAKARDFGGSLRRLLGGLRPEAPLVAAVILLAVISVTLAILGPKILGEATNLIFEGAISADAARRRDARTRSSPDCRRRARTSSPTMLSTMHLTPGQGIDFGALRSHPGPARRGLPAELAVRAGCRATSWPASPSAPSSGSAPTSTRSSVACPCAPSTDSRAATC